MSEDREERRRRFLSTKNTMKDDLQDIFASTESSYMYLRDISDHIFTVSDDIEKLKTILVDHAKDAEVSFEAGTTRLTEITEFCDSISETLDKLVDSLTANSESNTEELKKNRNGLVGLANTYRAMSDSIKEIKKLVETNNDSSECISNILRSLESKIELISSTINSQKSIILFFKNVNEEELPRILPKSVIAINEYLKEKGYDSQGNKKEPLNYIFYLFIIQLRNNLLSFLAILLLSYFANSWYAQKSQQTAVSNLVDQVKTLSDKVDTLNKAQESKSTHSRSN